MTEHAQRLVGRDRELEVLGALLGEAKDGIARFAQVSGEPGIGKTSLLATLGRGASDAGWLVLNGRCAELEREIPFGLVIDAFDAYLASLDPRAFDRIAADELDELAGLFPSLRSLVPEPEHPTTPAERFRAHRAVVEMIERLAARQPVLLLLDDLHWADAASIEQAGYVLRRPPEAAVVIVGSFRTGQADPALATAVATAAREGHVELLELGPLGPEDARALVGSVDGELYEASGGNPFYLLQLARSGTGRLVRDPASADGEGVPPAVAAAIGSELDAISPDARGMAEAAAVAGDPFELDLVTATAGVSELEALAHVDELIERDLLRPTAVPRTFQFRHPLVRTAIYERSSPGARLAAHQRAAEALTVRGAPAIERAHHVEQSARRGDAEAVAVLRDAGGEASGRAPASAARWFEAALRLLPPSAADDERLGMLMPLAGALAATGRLEDSRAAMLEAIELASPDGSVPRARIVSACATVEHLLGLPQQAHERLVTALEQVSDPEGAEASSLMIDLAVDAFFTSDFDGMREWGGRALAVARSLSEPALIGAAAAVSAFATSCTGPVPEAMALREEAAALIDSMSDDELAVRLDAMQWLSAADFYLEEYEVGERHAVRGLAVARASGQGELVPALNQALANILFTTGRPIEAGELLDDAVDAARLSDNAVGLAWSLLNRSYAAIIEGDIDTALATGEEAAALTEGGGAVSAWSGAICAAARMEVGEAQSAIEIMLARGGGERAELIPGGWGATWLEWATRCWLVLGRMEEAKRAAAYSRARAEEFGLSLPKASAAGAEAALALASGDSQTAAKRALRAAADAERVNGRFEAARWRALAGRALAESGDADAAAEQLERAAAAFDSFGSIRYRDIAERELGKLGRRVHRRSRPGRPGETGVEALTGRELEVARLVVDRHTNPEIAAELFLSVKTVETHMRNIFRKLDVSSRVEVARTVERAERAKPAS